MGIGNIPLIWIFVSVQIVRNLMSIKKVKRIILSTSYYEDLYVYQYSLISESEIINSLVKTLYAKSLEHMKLFALMLFIYVILQIDGALEAGKKIPLLDIGAGVYPTTLFFNHSCAPNTLRINQGTRVRKINKL